MTNRHGKSHAPDQFSTQRKEDQRSHIGGEIQQFAVGRSFGEIKSRQGDKPNGKEQAAADSLTTAQKNKLMKVINDGDDKALNELPGIGETRAAAIKKARPVADVVDLLKIDGIGEGTFLGIVSWAKGEPPPEPKKDEGKTKAKTKKKSS